MFEFVFFNNEHKTFYLIECTVAYFLKCITENKKSFLIIVVNWQSS